MIPNKSLELYDGKQYNGKVKYVGRCECPLII